jgi:D-arabinose 1-dehydrogenase-like Zn-dependent alcohol dehydrogenase
VDQAINSLKDDPTTFEPARSTIVFTRAQAAYDSAVNLTLNHGTIVAVGLPAQPTSINSKTPSQQRFMGIKEVSSSVMVS